MTSKTYENVIRTITFVGFLYMVFEFFFHLSGVRLLGIEKIWPTSAVIFIQLFMWLWTSASLFMAMVLFFVYRHFDLVKPLLRYMLLPIFFHVLLLCWLSMTPYSQILPLPSLYAWTPLYSWALRAEAASLFTGGILIAYGMHKKYL